MLNKGVGDSRVEFGGSDSELSLPGLARTWGRFVPKNEVEEHGLERSYPDGRGRI